MPATSPRMEKPKCLAAVTAEHKRLGSPIQFYRTHSEEAILQTAALMKRTGLGVQPVGSPQPPPVPTPKAGKRKMVPGTGRRTRNQERRF